MSTSESSTKSPGLQPVEPSSLVEWARGSRLVDAAGVPQTFYHGTQEVWSQMLSLEERLREFEVNVRGVPSDLVKLEREYLIRTGGAVWFTDDEWVAQGYSDQSSSPRAKGVVVACIKMANPLDLRSQAIGWEEAEQVVSAAYGHPVGISSMYGYEKGVAHAVISDNSRLIAYAKANGFDGLIYPDTDVCGRSVHNSFVVFEPTQLRVIRLDADQEQYQFARQRG